MVKGEGKKSNVSSRFDRDQFKHNKAILVCFTQKHYQNEFLVKPKNQSMMEATGQTKSGQEIP